MTFRSPLSEVKNLLPRTLPPGPRTLACVALCGTLALLFVGLANSSVGAAGVPGAIPGSDRVYELVSPADAAGPIREGNINQGLYGLHGNEYRESIASSEPPFFEPGGNLWRPAGSPILVRGKGSAVFWESLYTPPGTGALPDDYTNESFRSVRTKTGWTSEALFPHSQLLSNQSGVIRKLLAASADGSSALIITNIALDPAAFVDPQEAAASEWEGGLIYRVTSGAGAPRLTTLGSIPFPADAEMASGGLFENAAGPFDALSASPDLGTLAFRSNFRLDPSDTCSHRSGGAAGEESLYYANTYLWRASSSDGLAHPAVEAGSASCASPTIASVPTVLPDGRPLVYPSQVHQSGGGTIGTTVPTVAGGEPLGSQGYDIGPLVENSSDNASPAAFTPLTGPSGAEFLAASPDGQTAYVRSPDALDAAHPGAAGAENIYAVSTVQGTGWEGPGQAFAPSPSAACLTCATDAGADQQQSIAIAGAGGGTFTLSLGQQTTGVTAPGEGELTSGSTLVHLSGARNFTVGEAISGPGIPAGTTIVALGAEPTAAPPAIDNTLTLSQPATATATAVTLTADLPYDATAAAVRNALFALPGLQENVSVSGSPGGPFTLTFTGADAGIDQPQLTADPTGLTGAAPAVEVTTTQQAHGAPTYVGLSADGSRLFFTDAEGALWGYDFGAAQPLEKIAGASEEPSLLHEEPSSHLYTAHTQQLPISQNGEHLVAQTNAGLTEFNQGGPSRGVEPCGKADAALDYAVAVSDDGNRVVCDGESAGLEVINEWVGGQVTQISPQGAPGPYTVQAVTGAQLTDVFFLANQPLLPWDSNAGNTDIYDARIDGGFPEPPPCSGEACQGTPTPAPASSPPSGTATFSGPENQGAAAKKCKPGQVRKHGKCVQKKAGKHHHTRQTNTNRRAGK